MFFDVFDKCSFMYMKAKIMQYPKKKISMAGFLASNVENQLEHNVVLVRSVAGSYAESTVNIVF